MNVLRSPSNWKFHVDETTQNFSLATMDKTGQNPNKLQTKIFFIFGVEIVAIEPVSLFDKRETRNNCVKIAAAQSELFSWWICRRVIIMFCDET